MVQARLVCLRAALPLLALGALNLEPVMAADRDSGVCHWVSQVPSTSADPIAIATGPWPHVYATGSFSAPTKFDPDLAGETITPLGTDGYLLQYSSSGAFEEVWHFGECEGDPQAGQDPRALAVCPDGSICVAGHFAEAVHFGDCADPLVDCDLYSVGTTANIFVAKISASGDCLWARSFGNSDVLTVAAVSVDDVGNVFLLGYFDGTVDFGGEEFSATTRDIFVAAFAAADGGHLWSAAYTSSGTDTPTGIVQTPSGGFALAGEFDGTLSLGNGITLTAAAGYQREIFIAEFAGDLQSGFAAEWGATFGSPAIDAGSGLDVAPSGSLVVACRFRDTLFVEGVGYPGVANLDCAIVQFDGDGAAEWVRTFGGNSNGDAVWAVAADSGGDVYATGYLTGLVDLDGITFGEDDAVRRGLLAKLDGTDGSVFWVLDPFGTYSGEAAEGAWVSLDSWDYVYLTGKYSGVPFAFGDCTQQGSAPGFFTGKVGGTATSTPGDSSPSGDGELPTVWPNPFFQRTTIEYSVDRWQDVTVDIADVQGRQVRQLWSGLLGPGEHIAEWDGRTETGAKAASGVYVCRITTPGSSVAQRICLLR